MMKAGGSSKLVENVAQRMAINGRRFCLNQVWRKTILPQYWIRHLLTISKRYCGVCESEYSEDTKDFKSL